MGSGLDTAGRSEGMNVTFRIDGEVTATVCFSRA